MWSVSKNADFVHDITNFLDLMSIVNITTKITIADEQITAIIAVLSMLLALWSVLGFWITSQSMFRKAMSLSRSVGGIHHLTMQIESLLLTVFMITFFMYFYIHGSNFLWGQNFTNFANYELQLPTLRPGKSLSQSLAGFILPVLLGFFHNNLVINQFLQTYGKTSPSSKTLAWKPMNIKSLIITLYVKHKFRLYIFLN
jgi:hypothetical protein